MKGFIKLVSVVMILLTVFAIGTSCQKEGDDTSSVPTLAVTPTNQIVSFTPGEANFSVTSNTNWYCASDSPWCTVPASGSGNGNMIASFTDNQTGYSRKATITITVNGIPPVQVTIRQTEGHPAFKLTATTVNLQGGGFGLQFYASCNTDDVKMTYVIITDPLASSPMTFNLNGNIFAKYVTFALQSPDYAYPKKIGTWSFKFVGNLTSDGSPFSVSQEFIVQ